MMLMYTGVCMAQVNPKKGYIVTNENDTVHGMVDFRTNAINAHECLFKAEGENGYVRYMPGDIVSYRFSENGKLYVSRNFNDEATVFAEFMVKGKLSLYRVSAGFSDVFYVENEDGKVLRYEEKSESPKDALKNAQDLFAEVALSPQATRDIKVGSMDSRRMIKLVKDYHADMCASQEECIEFEYDDRSDKSQWSISAFAGAGQVWWTGDALELLEPMPNKLGMVAGICFDFERSRVAKGQQLQLSCMYANFDTGTWRYKTLHGLFVGIGPQFRFGKEHSACFTARAGYMPSMLFGCERFVQTQYEEKKNNDFVQFFLLSAYAGIGVEVPAGKHAVTFNLDYRCVELAENNWLTGTIGWRF